jgi:hypothetical protein
MPISKLSRMGGARAYVPRAVRDKAASKDLQRRYRKLAAREEREGVLVLSEPGVSHATAAFKSEEESGAENGAALASAPAPVTAAAAAGFDSRKRARQESGAPRHRFSGAEAIARERAAAAAAAQARRLEADNDRDRAAARRKASTRLVRQKTHRGQPLLKSRMAGLLSKVERLVGSKPSIGSSGK